MHAGRRPDPQPIGVAHHGQQRRSAGRDAVDTTSARPHFVDGTSAPDAVLLAETVGRVTVGLPGIFSRISSSRP
jgi:hypothetical protein